MNDSEWEERQKARGLEMEACSKALSVLTSDDAHDMFSKTLNFVQMESTMHSQIRAKASKLLEAVASKYQNPRMAALAYRMKLDAFTKVKQSMDDMVAALLKEKADEIKLKDFCVDEFNKNAMETDTKKRGKTDVDAKLADLTMSIKGLTSAISELKAEIGEMQGQLKRAGEDRATQNKEFQMTVADQRATQQLLASALNILKGFYAKSAAAALVQSESAGAPSGFGAAKTNGAAGGVMGMIQQIITDAKEMEAEATRDEADAKKAYENTAKETNASIKTKTDAITTKSGDKAKKDAELVENNKNEDNAVLELEQLASANAALHSSCDFVTKNFEIRQSARDDEVEALKQAKSILSGAKFSAFLQAA